MRSLCILFALLCGLTSLSEAEERVAVKQTSASVQVSADHVTDMKRGLSLFQRDVRGLLSQHCVKCHGGQWVKGGFDLGTRGSLMESGMVGATGDNSRLLGLLRHEEEPHMPHDAPRLSDAAIASIAEWIDLGAPYDKPLVAGERAKGPMQITEVDRQFWAFQPLAKESPPQVASPWIRNAIDRFVFQRLADASLVPNPIADKRRLIRRAYFDLIGLPPTPDEVQAFLDDESEDAYAELIDSLLESSHYGERWARHWMDVARFAESHGYEQDYNRPHAYHYRDFLIRAFNDDLPYDQFVAWQLAGDELDPTNPLAMKATGFLGAGAFPTQLTEAEFESARYDELDDMTTTTGVAFLGLSVGCARCHDHKFDPIPTKDYYALAATFTATIRSEQEIEVDPEFNAKSRREHAERLAAAEKQIEAYRASRVREPFFEWIRSGQTLVTQWEVLDAHITSTSEGEWEKLPDGSRLSKYATPDDEVLTVTAPVEGRVHSLRLEALTHASFPQNGPGRAPNGNFALGDIRVRLLHRGVEPKAIKLTAARATHQQNQNGLSVAASIDHDPISGWAVDAGGIGKGQAAVFDFAEAFDAAEGDRLEVTLVLQHPNAKHTLGRVRLSTSEAAGVVPEVGNVGPPPKVVAARQRLRASWKVGDEFDPQSPDAKIAFDYFLETDAKFVSLRRELEQMLEGPKLKTTKVQVSSEGVPPMKHHADGRGYPHFYPQTHFLNRGDVHQKQEVIDIGFLQVLTQPGHEAEQRRLAVPAGSKKSYRRATLAGWITDPQRGAGHLAARVIVNRLWHHHFGRGIVATPNDFGFQGERPTHPELLDYLASDLIRHGWRLKRLHKQIMTSAAYMQSSDLGDRTRRQIDVDNLLLWRRVPRRLEAEAIRDSMLSVAGMLDRTMYGPGTLDVNMKRRSTYFLIKRSKLISPMMLFDWPEHLVSIGRRATTTIAPQALMFLNSPQGQQYSASFSERLPDALPQAVERAYWLAYSRPPTALESELSQAFLIRQQEKYTDETRAEQLAKRDFCQALFSGNEFIYID